jgi:outer membrane protein assembly factor BamD
MIRHSRTGPHGRKATIALRAGFFLLAALASGCGGSLKEQQSGVADYERGKAAFDQSNWYDAIADLKTYVEQYPGTEKTDDALYYLGEAYFRNKDFALASGQFDRLIRDFPQSPLQPDALFLLARCDDVSSRPPPLDQTETLRAIDRYRQFLDSYPEHTKASEARERLAALRERLAEKRFRNGRLYAKLHQDAAASFYLEGVLKDYAETRWAGDAALLLAEIYVRQGKRDEAIAALRRIPQDLATAEVRRKGQERLRSLGDAGLTP